MKRICSLIFVLLSFSSDRLQAQFVLEAVYDTASTTLYVITLEISGEKYIRTTGYATDRKMYLYNLDHSLWKTIDLASMPINTDPFGAPLHAQYSVLYVSENLFNNDPALEFLFCTTIQWKTGVYDEFGNTLFFADSCAPLVKLNIPIVQKPIYNTAYGTKMILSDQTGHARVYGLAGTLTEMVDIFGDGIKLTSHPNPARDFTMVEYELPVGANEGLVEIYDMSANLFKSYRVDRTFRNLMIPTTELAAGQYTYVLKTANSIISQKQIIIK